MNKKYQVFISSTFTDLKEERQDISRSILNLDHIPAGMEMFPAIDEDQLDYIKKVIDDCDYYVLIIGGRYGSTSESGVSYTEREYDYAIERGIRVIALIHADAGQISVAKSDTDPAVVARLDAFRNKAKTGRMVRFWTDKATLQAGFFESFAMTMSRYPAVGWVRGDTVSNEATLSQLNAVRDENDRLRQAIADLAPKQPPQISGIATLDDTYTIRYFYTEYFNRDVRTRYGHENFSWRQIFGVVAPEFLKPLSPSAMKGLLSSHMVQQKMVPKAVTIVEECYSTIKIQFMALGLMDSYEAESSTGGLGEFAKLTEKGKEVMIDSLVVRRAILSTDQNT